MKALVRFLGLISLVFSQVCFFNIANLPVLSIVEASADESWKNFYGIAWPGRADDNVRYAKQMGNDYIALVSGAWNRTQYANTPNRAGLKFYIIEPTYLQEMVPVIGQTIIDTSVSLTQAQIDYFNNYMVWKSMAPFPDNLAPTSYFTSTRFRTVWDIQQQAVIDYLIAQIISLAKSYEDTSIGFTFAGWMSDNASLCGRFAYWNGNQNVFVTLPYFTGTDSGLIHDSITHEYSTYTEGNAAFFKQLNAKMRQEFPDAKWILEPWRIYSAANNDAWVNQIKDRGDKGELTPDMLFQESFAGTTASALFVGDTNNFNSGVNITKDMVGITQPTLE